MLRTVASPGIFANYGSKIGSNNLLKRRFPVGHFPDDTNDSTIKFARAPPPKKKKNNVLNEIGVVNSTLWMGQKGLNFRISYTIQINLFRLLIIFNPPLPPYPKKSAFKIVLPTPRHSDTPYVQKKKVFSQASQSYPHHRGSHSLSRLPRGQFQMAQ